MGRRRGRASRLSADRLSVCAEEGAGGAVPRDRRTGDPEEARLSFYQSSASIFRPIAQSRSR